VKDPTCAITRGTTYDNRANLADKFFRDTVSRYEGTRLGRQELYADILSDNPDALFKASQIDALRVRLDRCPLPFRRIVIGVDPPVSTGESADECGIIVAGLGQDGHAYVLADNSSRGEHPNAWARRVLKAYALWQADRIIVEVNQGGAMVRNTLEQANKQFMNLPVLTIRETHAYKGKVLRAEPVSTLYEQGRVHHVGNFGQLEDQMTNFTIDFDPKTAGYSPDRLDALVYAINDLVVQAGMPGGIGRMRMR
jgi:phage terminase large subunit-like protein